MRWKSSGSCQKSLVVEAHVVDVVERARKARVGGSGCGWAA
jgi:hypothetical protein